MINLIIFILSCYGMTMIIVYSKIFESLRNKINSYNNDLLTYMLKCCMCMGFWVGIFNSFLIKIPCNIFVSACISSGTSYFISRIVDDDGILIKMKKSK